MPLGVGYHLRGDVMRFKQYLVKRRLEYDARSDFTRLANADPRFPDADTLNEVQSYLHVQYSNEVIRHAAAEVWKEYQADVLKSMRVGMPRLSKPNYRVSFSAYRRFL